MVTPENESGGWNQWSLYIIKTIDLLQKKIDTVEEEMKKINLQIQTELTELKTGFKFSTAIAAIVVSLLVSVISGVIVYNVTTDKAPQQKIYSNEK